MSLSSVTQTALSGLRASETMLGVAADNLANLQTPGFKQSQVQLSTRPSVGATGTQLGTGVQVAAIAPDTAQGALVLGQPLNLAISGNGYFVLEGSQGQNVYSRDGAFHANADGELVSTRGKRVLGAQGDPNVFQGELSPLFVLNPQSTGSGTAADGGSFASRYSIEPNGLIRRHMADGLSRMVGRVRLAQFNNPAGLRALGDNTFQATASSGPAQIGAPNSGGRGRLSHALEASNSHVASNVIGMSRAELLFRANAKVISVADSLYDELLALQRR